MGLIDFLEEISKLGYDDIDDYCNQNGLNICDVVDDEDDED